MLNGFYLFFQGGAKRNSYHDISQRYGLNPNLKEEELQLQLEEMRENLKKEIRKEMKIKEGAEKLREATTDKKILSDVNSIVKKANSKLKELHNELLEINSNLLMSNSHTHMESMAGKKVFSVHSLYNKSRFGGVMVSMLVWSAVDHGFEPRSGHSKDYKIDICCFSAQHTALRRKNNK